MLSDVVRTVLGSKSTNPEGFCPETPSVKRCCRQTRQADEAQQRWPTQDRRPGQPAAGSAQ